MITRLARRARAAAASAVAGSSSKRSVRSCRSGAPARAPRARGGVEELGQGWRSPAASSTSGGRQPASLRTLKAMRNSAGRRPRPPGDGAAAVGELSKRPWSMASRSSARRSTRWRHSEISGGRHPQRTPLRLRLPPLRSRRNESGARCSPMSQVPLPRASLHCGRRAPGRPESYVIVFRRPGCCRPPGPPRSPAGPPRWPQVTQARSPDDDPRDIPMKCVAGSTARSRAGDRAARPAGRCSRTA